MSDMIDPDVVAMNEVYEAGRGDAERMMSEVDSIREESRAMGILQKIRFDNAQNEMLKYTVLWQLKQSKEYKKGGLTWAQFCESIGEARPRVDEKLRDLKPFFDEFQTESAHLLNVPFNKIRYLGQQLRTESVHLDGRALVVDGQSVELKPENKDDIEALIDELKESHKRELKTKDKVLQEKKDELSAQKRVSKKKQERVEQLEQEIAKYERQAEARGMVPEESAYLDEMEKLRQIFDGFAVRLDPDNLHTVPPDATPRMIAAYLSTLRYMQDVIQAAAESAVVTYGNPGTHPEAAWHQPDDEAEEDNSSDGGDDSGVVAMFNRE